MMKIVVFVSVLTLLSVLIAWWRISYQCCKDRKRADAARKVISDDLRAHENEDTAVLGKLFAAVKDSSKDKK